MPAFQPNIQLQLWQNEAAVHHTSFTATLDRRNIRTKLLLSIENGYFLSLNHHILFSRILIRLRLTGP